MQATGLIHKTISKKEPSSCSPPCRGSTFLAVGGIMRGAVPGERGTRSWRSASSPGPLASIQTCTIINTRNYFLPKAGARASSSS